MKRLAMLSELNVGDTFLMSEGGTRYQLLCIIEKGTKSVLNGWVCKAVDVQAYASKEFVVKGDRPVMDVEQLEVK